MKIEEAKMIAKNNNCLLCDGILIVKQEGILFKKTYLKCSNCGKIWENESDFPKNEKSTQDFFGIKNPPLKIGPCIVSSTLDDFLEVTQIFSGKMLETFCVWVWG